MHPCFGRLVPVPLVVSLLLVVRAPALGADGQSSARGFEEAVRPTNLAQIAHPDWMKIEPTGRWCAAKAVWLAAIAYGRNPTLEAVVDEFRRCGAANGVGSLEDVEEVARALGLQAVAVKTTLSAVQRASCLALTIHRVRPNSSGRQPSAHIVVVLGVSDGIVSVIDPINMTRVLEIPVERFERSWSGSAVFIAPDNAFIPKPEWSLFSHLVLCLVVDAVVIIAACRWLHRWSGWRTSPLVLLFGVVFFGGCWHQPSASYESDMLKFDELEYEAPGLLSDDRTPVAHSFHFTNVASRAVKIVSVRSPCNCTVVDFDRHAVPPSGRGTVSLRADLRGRSGDFATNALVFVDDSENPVARLTLAARIIPPITVMPTVVEFGHEWKPGNSKKILIRIPVIDGEAIPTVRIASESPDFTTSLEKVRRGDTHDRLSLVVAEASVAPVAGKFKERGWYRSLIKVLVKDQVFTIPIRARVD